MAIEEEIRKLAYSLWEQEGRPEGQHEEHYFRAKQILEEQEAALQANRQDYYRDSQVIIGLKSEASHIDTFHWSSKSYAILTALASLAFTMVVTAVFQIPRINLAAHIAISFAVLCVLGAVTWWQKLRLLRLTRWIDNRMMIVRTSGNSLTHLNSHDIPKPDWKTNYFRALGTSYIGICLGLISASLLVQGWSHWMSAILATIFGAFGVLLAIRPSVVSEQIRMRLARVYTGHLPVFISLVFLGIRLLATQPLIGRCAIIIAYAILVVVTLLILWQAVRVKFRAKPK
jgi:hypothetical protein